jgi:hypothetical protein
MKNKKTKKTKCKGEGLNLLYQVPSSVNANSEVIRINYDRSL